MPQTKEAAHDTLFSRVYAPVFFEKLANSPYVPKPNTQEDAEHLLNIGAKLRIAHDSGVVKTAAVANPFEAADQLLDTLLSKTASTNNPDQVLAMEAKRLATDPTLVSAAIDYQNAVAQELMAAGN